MSVEELLSEFNRVKDSDDHVLFDSILDKLEKVLSEDEFIKLCESIWVISKKSILVFMHII